MSSTSGLIAYDREGDGPVVVLIGGAMQFRAVDADTRALAHELAARDISAINYDRPGRGESTSGSAPSLGTEIEAIEHVIAAAGGRVALYGSSSGGAIAIAAATQLSGVDALVIWEPPVGPAGGTQGAQAVAQMRQVLPSGDPEQIVATFMHGMPPEWFAAIRNGADWPHFAAMAPTLLADAEALAWAQDASRDQTWAAAPAGATVLVGEGAFDFLADAAASVAATLPDARLRTLPGDGHSWRPHDLADAIAAAVRAA